MPDLLQKKTILAARLVMLVSLTMAIIHSPAGETAALSHLSHFQKRAVRTNETQIAEQTSRLNSSNVEERIDAALKLAALKDPAAIPALSKAIDDRDENVRAIAIDGLARTGDPQVVPMIAERLERDRNVFVKKTAAYALGRLGSAAGTATLLRALKDKNDEVRGAASIALARYTDPSAVDGLIAALNDKNDFVRANAARALGLYGRGALQAVQHLIKLLDSDPALGVKRESATSLGHIGDPAALDSLERARLSTDPYLSRAAASAIKRIKK